MQYNWENYFDINSEYWKKVQQIYTASEHFPKKVVKDRNLHHKFPRSFSKKENVDIDDDEDNLVSLSLSDHFLVHYYLWKCAKKGFRQPMALAFSFMRKKMIVYASEETIEQLAKDYENIMKDVVKAHRRENLSKETRKKMSEKSKGRQPMLGKHHSKESKKKMSESHKGKPGKPLSEETKKKISESHKGYQHNEETRQKMSESHKGKQLSEEIKKKLSEARRGEKNPFYGKKHSDKTIQKISDNMKIKHVGENNPAYGRHWYNNGKINKFCFECPEGFKPGMLLIIK